MSELHPVNTQEEAIALATKLTHFDMLTGLKISARQVTISANDAFYVGEQIVNRKAWRVEFANVSLKLKSAIAQFHDLYHRTFTILIDEDTGQLLSIASRYEGKAPDMRPLPSAQSTEAQIKEQQEIYLGLPPDKPKLPFLDALDAILSHGIGSPFQAKEIYAVYVIHSKMGSEPRHVWAVTLRGLPPLPAHGAHGDRVPIWQRDHIRNVIDADTGTILFATNVPQPIG